VLRVGKGGVPAQHGPEVAPTSMPPRAKRSESLSESPLVSWDGAASPRGSTSLRHFALSGDLGHGRWQHVSRSPGSSNGRLAFRSSGLVIASGSSLLKSVSPSRLRVGGQQQLMGSTFPGADSPRRRTPGLYGNAEGDADEFGAQPPGSAPSAPAELINAWSAGVFGDGFMDSSASSATPPPASDAATTAATRLPKRPLRRPNLTIAIPQRALQRQLRSIRLLREDQKIFDLYSWREVLQEEGDGGKVVVCQSKEASEDCARYVMKIRSKESLQQQCHEEEFRKSQIRMLNFPPHVGVVPLHEVLEDELFYYIVMDKADGGNFFYSLVSDFKDGNMPIAAVKTLMREILEAVCHMHRHGVLHRDIKPDNLVMQVYEDPLSPTGKSKKVMLIDFDHADPDWCPSSPSKDHHCYGTLRFNAPETFRGEYSAASDLYSIGAILYLLMAGKLPYRDAIFEEEHQSLDFSPITRGNWMDHVYMQLRQETIDWQCSPWPDQLDCQDFCASLLAFKAADRFRTAEEAMAHRWLGS